MNHALAKRLAMNPADSTRNAAARNVLVGVHLSQFVVDRFKTSMTLKIQTMNKSLSFDTIKL